MTLLGNFTCRSINLTKNCCKFIDGPSAKQIVSPTKMDLHVGLSDFFFLNSQFESGNMLEAALNT